ncbi:MAG TPA: cyanophycinase [Gemmatimonadaceae bacterium]|jgi:cyanophycinase|nr:cyanophycinase [Gemmatimonadaceae bacterium]
MPAPTDKRDIPRVDADVASHDDRVPASGAGALVLIGGALSRDGHALRGFVDLVNARGPGPVVGLTTASAEPEETGWYWTGVLRGAGVRDVRVPMFDRVDEKRDREIAAMIGDAAGVFLGGGDQVKLVTALSGSETAAAIRRAYERGATVAGTSAGAAALTELTMAGGEVDVEGNLVEQYIGPGLGLLGFDAIVDTHFSQRRRLQRLFLVVAKNTRLFGVGIDEDTALIVRDGIGEVVGAGSVTFVDGRETVLFDNAQELDKGRQLTLSHLRVGIVGTKYHLDFRARDLHELVTNEPSRHRRTPQETSGIPA